MVRPSTLGELVASGYRPRTVREELRANLAARLRAREPFLPEMIGYSESVVPALEHALLAGHDMIFLGERGQGKSKMIRKLVELLDEVAGAATASRSWASARRSPGSAARRATARSSRPRTRRSPT